VVSDKQNQFMQTTILSYFDLKTNNSIYFFNYLEKETKYGEFQTLLSKEVLNDISIKNIFNVAIIFQNFIYSKSYHKTIQDIKNTPELNDSDILIQNYLQIILNELKNNLSSNFSLEKSMSCEYEKMFLSGKVDFHDLDKDIIVEFKFQNGAFNDQNKLQLILYAFINETDKIKNKKYNKTRYLLWNLKSNEILELVVNYKDLNELFADILNQHQFKQSFEINKNKRKNDNKDEISNKKFKN
jgi:hypothetical protein